MGLATSFNCQTLSDEKSDNTSEEKMMGWGGRGKNDDRMAKKNVCVNALPWKKFFWNYYVWWCGWSWRPGWPGECGEYRDYLDYVSHVVIHLIKENRRPAENGLCDGNKELESLKCREETSAFSCDWWSTALMKTFAVSEFLPNKFNQCTYVDPSICTQFQLQRIPHLPRSVSANLHYNINLWICLNRIVS